MTDGRAQLRILALEWGVKESFRRYVEATEGEIAALDGATRAEDGSFIFPAREAEGAALSPWGGEPAGEARFTGAARFHGHGGMLAVFLADPAIEVSPEGWRLTACDSPRHDQRIVVATLQPPGPAEAGGTELVLACAITYDGGQLLGGHYPPGTPIDAVRLRLG